MTKDHPDFTDGQDEFLGWRPDADIRAGRTIRPAEHRKMLKGVDERVLSRRELETDEEYGKRMYDFLNCHDIYTEKYK